MSRSRRHHYIPQFWTKHFSNEEEKIFLYDKFEDRIFKGSALNLFVAKDRNTFLNDKSVEDDVIEQMYTSFDSRLSLIFNQITTSNKVSSENYKWILFFAYLTKWRVPQYDESFKNAKDFFSVDDLGLGFKDMNDDKINVSLEEFFELDMHQEMKRFLLAFQPIRFRGDFQKIIANSFMLPSPSSAFISDCPFNEYLVNSSNVFEDFVFPVTKDLTLIYNTRIDRSELMDFINNGDPHKVGLFLHDFSMNRDLSALHLSERMVGCSDENYLQQIVDLRKAVLNKKPQTALNQQVFVNLQSFKEYI